MKLINKYSRRKFIGTASISGISVLLGSSYLLSACSQKEKITDQVIPSIDNEVIHKISCQLYTFRNQMKEALKISSIENSKIAFTLRTRALGNVFKQLRLDCT